jgi:high-affinity Fe2+/Pb2+ permease
MPNEYRKTKSIYFALIGVGAFVVACAAFMSYLFSLGLDGQHLNGQEVARRMVIILFLVVAVFELALWLLHRVIARMDEIINRQTEELEEYSRQLELVVTEQLARIEKIKCEKRPAKPKAATKKAQPTQAKSG